MVQITGKSAEVLTKYGKALTDISYTINDDDDDDADESEEDNDAKLAKKIAREEEANPSGGRKSRRLANNQASSQEVEGQAERERKQIELMKRKNEERLRELARSSKKKGDDGKTKKAEELEAYKRTKDLPDNILPNQVKVDMANQCVILPICGNPVAFHISTIKNVVLPDPDSASYLRINFYTAGMALGKDAPENTAKLVQKYAPYATFIREVTFRSLDSHSLTTVSLLPLNIIIVLYMGNLHFANIFFFCAGIPSNLSAQKECQAKRAPGSRGSQPCQAGQTCQNKERACPSSLRPDHASCLCWSQDSRQP